MTEKVVSVDESTPEHPIALHIRYHCGVGTWNVTKEHAKELRRQLGEALVEPSKPELVPCRLCGTAARRSLSNHKIWLCDNDNCYVVGPEDDLDGAKWNKLMAPTPQWDGNTRDLDTVADLLEGRSLHASAATVRSATRFIYGLRSTD